MSITPQDGYSIASKVLPNGFKFNGKCLDYTGMWAFPLETSTGETAFGAMIFVDQSDGAAYPHLPWFDIGEFVKSPDVSDQVEFDVMAHTVYLDADVYEALADQGRYLAHYGVRGMHWGIRHDKPSSGHKRSSKVQDRVSLGSTKPQSRTSTSDVQRLGWHPITHNVMAKPGVVNRNAEFRKANPGLFEYKSSAMSGHDDMKAVNPYMAALKTERTVKGMYDWKYSNNKPYWIDNLNTYGATVNCATCSTAYVLRRQGFDVSADMSVGMAGINTNLDSYFPGATWSELGSNVDRVDGKAREVVNGYPNGAYGILTYDYKDSNTGHAIAWEKEDGRIVYRDCQTGKEMEKLEASGPITHAQMSRLDDKTPDLAVIASANTIMKTPKTEPKPAKDDRKVLEKVTDRISTVSKGVSAVNKLKRRM